MLCRETVELRVHNKKRKINDETNVANIGTWHSEHAKKLTRSFSFLKKKKSLHILKCNDPRESLSAFSFLLLTSGVHSLLLALLEVSRKFLFSSKSFLCSCTRRDVFCWSFSSWSSSATSSCLKTNTNNKIFYMMEKFIS